jgi:hypothetical protein
MYVVGHKNLSLLWSYASINKCKRIETVGHLFVRYNESSWVFDRRMGMITPSSGGINVDMLTNQNTNDAATDTDAVTDTDADTMDSNEVDVDSYDDSSVDSGNSSVGAVAMMGNQIVHIPSVASVISKDACCCQCTEDNFTSFLLFCFVNEK